MSGTRVQLLGPVEARVEGRPVPLGARKQRLVLAILALEVNRQVPIERLVDLVWPADPPRTASHAVRVCVSGLRSALGGAAGVDIQTRGSGYVLAADPMDIDAHQFRALLVQARELADDNARIALLDQALRLWSGPALAAAAPPETQERLCSGLEESRLAATEDLLDARLRLGQHRELVDELADLTAAHPLRERLAGQQMLALHRSGRSADALAAFRRARRYLAEQLGIDPGTALQRLELAILRDDPALLPDPPSARGPSVTVPAQLPPAVAGFTGRADQLRELDACAGSVGDSAPGIAVIVGTAGVGKSALAVHWAQQHRDRYPDGQLYVNLGGHGPGTPMRPEQALGSFLRALSVPAEQIPLDLDEATGMYRSLLADKRMLVLLDNALAPDQVRPLLPGGRGCLTLVTSRDRLTGLAVRDGARLLSLGVLGAGEARALLAGLLGPVRVREEADSADQLGQLCAYLPLALRIAAAHLARHPRRRLADLAAALRGENRLAVLEIEGDEQSAVRATFDLSYVALKPRARRMFRQVGLIPGTDLTALAAAALTATPADEARQTLEALADAHLLDEHAPGRFTMHDLLRLHAQAHTAAEDGDAERAAALARLCDFYLRTTDSAARTLYPQMQRLPLPEAQQTAEGIAFTDDTAALAWLEAERSNLIATIERAAARGPRPVAWLLVDALRGYFWMRRHAAEWLAAGTAARAAADAERDAYGQATAHLCLAQANRFLSRHDAAVEHFAQALAHARRAGWRQGEAAALGSIANVYRDQGRLTQAAEYHRRAWAIFQQTGSPGGEAVSLTNLGNVLLDSGQLTEGIEHLDRALAIYRRIGANNAQAHVINSIGCAYHAQGRLDAALERLNQALALHRAAGSREGEADTLNNLGEVHADAGRYDEATRLARASLAIAHDAGDRRVEADARNTLAAIHRLRPDLPAGAPDARQPASTPRTPSPRGAIDAAGAPDTAGPVGSSEGEQVEALRVAREAGNRRGEALALIGLAEAHARAGAPEPARSAIHDALRAARRDGYRMIEGAALTGLAAIELAAGDPAEAHRRAREAVAIQRQSGYRLGQARALLVLGRVDAAADPAAARTHWEAALALFRDIGAPEAAAVQELLDGSRSAAGGTMTGL